MQRRLYTAAVGVILLLVVGGAIAVFAQAGPVVTVNRPFALLADHNPANTTNYQLTITGASNYSATLPVSANVGGVITFEVPGLATAGNETAIISAIGPGGTVASDPFAFVVAAAAPAKPASVRLVLR